MMIKKPVAFTASSLLISLTLASPVNAATRSTSYTYDPTTNQIATLNGPRTDVSDITTFTYDSTTGNLSKITDALGHETIFSNHDGNGRPQTITDPNGLITTLTYHPRGWLTSRTVDGHTTTFDYDNVGQLEKLTLPTGAFISYTYDAAHRLTDITDNLGNTIHYTLDPMGNRTKEETKDPSGTLTRVAEREFNQLNQLLLMISGEGNITRYAYDHNGNQTAMTDPRNTGSDRTAAGALDPLQTDNTIQSLYDALNRLVEVVHLQSANNSTDDVSTTYEYNALDQLTKVIDPNGLETIYTYNALGDLEQLNSPDTGITTYTYDNAGNRLTQTDARSVTTTYTYDALNRLTSVSYPDSSLNVTYTYDQNNNGENGIGRLTTMTDASGNTKYFYDKRGNITDKVITTDGLVSTFSFAYNGADQLTQVTYPSGRQIDYDYDLAGRIDQVSMTEDGTTTILAENLEYTPFGPITALDFGNGLPMTRQYDLDYRISTNVQGIVLDKGYQYDEASNIDQITDNLNVNNNQTFGYDGLSRLTSTLGNYGSQSYGYDKTGNRTQKIDNSTTDNYNYPSNSHHLSDINNAEIFSYDQNGNTTDLPNTDIFTSLSYGDQNRLTSVNSTAYTYNGSGERVKKAGAETTYFDYGLNGELLAERDSTGDITKEYVFLNGELLAALSGATNPTNPPTVDDIIIDNGDSNTSSTGSWSVSGNPGFHDTDSLYASNTATYRWTPNIITAGDYQVYAWWTEHWNRSANAPYTIHHADGSNTVTVNQTPSGQGGGQWVLLDTYNFAAGSSGYIELTASYDNNHSFSADAIKLVYASGSSSNNTPTVNLTAPAEGATYTEGDTITITANASDSDGSISSVEFYAGTTLLSTDTSAPYSYSWTSATAGSHSLTAIAYDDQSASTPSSAINITVNPAGGSVADIIIDDTDTEASSLTTWSASSGSPSHTGGANTVFKQGAIDWFRWTPTIATTGQYTVYAWWTYHYNRAPAAPYTINHANGSDVVNKAQNDNNLHAQWVELGTYTFNAGSSGYIQLDSDDSGRSFNADAVKLVYASGGSSNNNPTVNLTAPAEGATYTEGDTITITANASDSDGSISSVEFYAGTTLLSTDTSTPYSYSWTSATAGSHSLTAIAYDDQSASTPSSAINITVNPAGGSVADIIIDNGDSNTSSTGSWSVSGNPGFHDTDSLYASNTATYRWTPNIITAGDYQVYAWWTEHANRTTSAPYITHYNGGSQTVTVNQTPSGQGGGQWVLLDTYNFTAGSSGYIELTASYDNNHSFSADAIKLVYVGGQ